MKIQHLIILSFFLYGTLCNAQVYYYKNTDSRTHGKMTKITASHAITTAANGAMLWQVEDAEDKMETRYDYEFLANKYDGRSEFIIGSTIKAAMAIGADILAGRFNDAKTPYFSQSKKTYINNVGDNTLDLIYMQAISSRNVRSSSRQEIYRTRRDILRTYSKDEKHIRTLLLLAAAAYGFQNDADFLIALQAGEILL